MTYYKGFSYKYSECVLYENSLKEAQIKWMPCPSQAVRVEHCERVHVIAAAKRICIANCRECVFFLGVNQQPLIVGDNHKLQVSVAIYVIIWKAIILDL